MPAARAVPLLIALAVAASLAACGDDVTTRRGSSDIATEGDAAAAAELVADGCVLRDGAPELRRTVRRGETLEGIAREVYGDPALWREIRHANPDVVAEDGAVRAGAELRIPFEGR